MIIPVRCFTCGKVIAPSYEAFTERYAQYSQSIKDGEEPKKNPTEILNDLGVDRYCCRRMIIAHVDLIKDVSPYE